MASADHGLGGRDPALLGRFGPAPGLDGFCHRRSSLVSPRRIFSAATERPAMNAAKAILSNRTYSSDTKHHCSDCRVF